MALLDSFLKYVKIDTQSDENSLTTPSSMKQYDLISLLKDELLSLGLEPFIDEYGRLYVYIEGNKNYNGIGFCSHVDTASECSGKNVNPQIIYDYDLSDIRLGNSEYILSINEFPKLNELKGKTIITTDGTTLLGADDKAGIAIIMESLRRYLKIDQDKRKSMSILFTPDEEIGRGADHFNKERFNVPFAYTIDGGDPKYLAIENFNAKSINIEVIGKSIHPGSAKGIMVNAILVLNYFMSQLDENMIPAKTSGREGFNHVVSINGEVEKATANYILRNHDKNLLEQQINDFYIAKEKTLQKYPKSEIRLVVKDSYRNMKEIIDLYPDAKNEIEKTYKKLGILYEYEPIRGGTDGATFSFLGTPCPNLGTGSYNHHGRFEFAVLEEMELMCSIILNLLKL